MKATAPTTAFEAGLYELLVRVVPGAGARNRSPSMSTPGGCCCPTAVLSSATSTTARRCSIASSTVASQYGQLQVDLAAHVDDLLALGVADMRPERMRERFDEAFAVASACADAHHLPDKAAALERVAGLRDVFGHWCDRLADAPGPPTLDHNDLHGGNVFLTGPPAAPRPASSTGVTPWSPTRSPAPSCCARWCAGCSVSTPRPPQERAIVDAYLEPFDALRPARRAGRARRRRVRGRQGRPRAGVGPSGGAAAP